MPKATDIPITESRAAGAMPALVDLAHVTAALQAEQAESDRAMIAADKNSPEYHAAKAIFRRAEATGMALDDLALTLPVRTLSDAAAWSLFCFGKLDAIHNGDKAEKAGLSDSLGAIFRGIAGVAIVLAEAIGQDLDSFATPSTAALIRRHAGAGLVL